MPVNEVLKQAPEIIYVSTQNQEIDWTLITNIGLMVIVILGWIVVYRLNLKQQKENLKNNLRVKVYEEFWKYRSEFQNNSLSVLIHSGPPLILMRPIIIPGISDKLKEQKRAIDVFNKYYNELGEEKNKFTALFLNFWRNLEMWFYLMPDLNKAKESLTLDYAKKIEEVYDYIKYLSKLDKYKIDTWNEKEIREKGEEVWESFYNFHCYIEDMMVLIHNELMSPLLNFKKEIRRPLDDRFKVLTKEGLICLKNNK